ncbi:MAG: ExsB [uncultured bacterium]|nr:MAG: ExsB [uncultured bacterium]
MSGINKKAVVLLSGGLDSSTVLAIAKSNGYEIYAITFDYGQRHTFEIEAAKQIAITNNVKKHLIFKINLRQYGGSALTDDIDVPLNRCEEEISDGKIPVTYVPARNTIFLSIALGWAETLDVSDIFIGVNAIDYSGYPDCRPQFIKAFEKLAGLATKLGSEGGNFKIHTPLIKLKKSEIIKKGIKLGVDYGKTVTCYSPKSIDISCGKCDACVLRLKGFKEAGFSDPKAYADNKF